jgi:hypothetical protein
MCSGDAYYQILVLRLVQENDCKELRIDIKTLNAISRESKDTNPIR